MNRYRFILDQSIQLAAAGDIDAALSKLDEGVSSAVKENNQKWAAVLAKNAGLLQTKKGNLDEANKCYQTSLMNDDSDPTVHYLLGELYEKLGDLSLAQAFFRSGYEVAKKNNDQEMLLILKNNLRP
jgi:tetratricopeptide (TPR) repeat protein